MGNSINNTNLTVTKIQQPQDWAHTANTPYSQVLTNLRTGQQVEQYLIPKPYNHHLARLNSAQLESTELQYYEYRKVQNSNIVKVLYARPFSKSEVSAIIQKTGMQPSSSTNDGMSCFENGGFLVWTERIPMRLSDVSGLTFAEGLFVLRQSLVGLNIVKQVEPSLKINEEMICIDTSGRVKVWLNSSLPENHLQYTIALGQQNVRHSKSDTTFLITSLFNMIEYRVEGSRFPVSFAQRIRSLHEITISQALRILADYVNEHRIQLPDRLVLGLNPKLGLSPFNRSRQNSSISYQAPNPSNLFDSKSIQKVYYDQSHSRTRCKTQTQNVATPLRSHHNLESSQRLDSGTQKSQILTSSPQVSRLLINNSRYDQRPPNNNKSAVASIQDKAIHMRQRSFYHATTPFVNPNNPQTNVVAPTNSPINKPQEQPRRTYSLTQLHPTKPIQPQTIKSLSRDNSASSLGSTNLTHISINGKIIPIPGSTDLLYPPQQNRPSPGRTPSGSGFQTVNAPSSSSFNKPTNLTIRLSPEVNTFSYTSSLTPSGQYLAYTPVSSSVPHTPVQYNNTPPTLNIPSHTFPKKFHFGHITNLQSSENNINNSNKINLPSDRSDLNKADAHIKAVTADIDNKLNAIMKMLNNPPTLPTQATTIPVDESQLKSLPSGFSSPNNSIIFNVIGNSRLSSMSSSLVVPVTDDCKEVKFDKDTAENRFSPIYDARDVKHLNLHLNALLNQIQEVSSQQRKPL